MIGQISLVYYAVIVSDVEMFDQAGRAGPEYGHGRDNLLHARNFEHLKQFAVSMFMT